LSVRRLLIASCLVGIVAPIGYFATKYHTTPNGLTPQQTVAEYRREEASLTLAPQWKWPVAPVPSHMPNGQRIIYQQGWGRQAADLYWFCSWSSVTVNPKAPETLRQQALQHVLSMRTKYFYMYSLAAVSKPGFDDVLNRAAKGDLTELRRFYEANCPAAP
jgi:hypothetical protein